MVKRQSIRALRQKEISQARWENEMVFSTGSSRFDRYWMINLLDERLSALRFSLKSGFSRFRPLKTQNHDANLSVNMRVDPLSISPSSSSFLFLSLWLIYQSFCSDQEHRSTIARQQKHRSKTIKGSYCIF